MDQVCKRNKQKKGTEFKQVKEEEDTGSGSCPLSANGAIATEFFYKNSRDSKRQGGTEAATYRRTRTQKTESQKFQFTLLFHLPHHFFPHHSHPSSSLKLQLSHPHQITPSHHQQPQ